MNTRVVQSSRSNIGFDLPYFSFLLYILYIKNYSFLHYMLSNFFLSNNEYKKQTRIITSVASLVSKIGLNTLLLDWFLLEEQNHRR